MATFKQWATAIVGGALLVLFSVVIVQAMFGPQSKPCRGDKCRGRMFLTNHAQADRIINIWECPRCSESLIEPARWEVGNQIDFDAYRRQSP